MGDTASSEANGAGNGTLGDERDALQMGDDQQVWWLHVAVPESAVPEPLRRGLGIMARLAASDLGIPTPTIRYFQSLPLLSAVELDEAVRLLRSPKRMLDATGALVVWVSEQPPGVGLGGHARATEPTTIWVTTQDSAASMANTVMHEAQHLAQFRREAARNGIAVTDLRFDDDERTAQDEVEADTYMTAKRPLDDEQRATRRQARADWVNAVGPLFEGEWPDVQQVVFPMQYDADTLWDIAWLGAQWALGEAAA